MGDTGTEPTGLVFAENSIGGLQQQENTMHRFGEIAKQTKNLKWQQ